MNRRRIASRIYDGSIVVGWRIARWPWERKAWRERAGRLGIQAFSGWAVWRLAETFPIVPEAALGWWIIAAYRAAEDDEYDEDQDEEEGLIVGAHTIAQLREALADTVRELAGTATGVHLDRVLFDWKARGLVSRDRTLSEFREFVEVCGIPVRASLKVGGVVRIGVHLADLPNPSPTDHADGDVVG